MEINIRKGHDEEDGVREKEPGEERERCEYRLGDS
jgi:hypothetical protein